MTTTTSPGADLFHDYTYDGGYYNTTTTSDQFTMNTFEISSWWEQPQQHQQLASPTEYSNSHNAYPATYNNNNGFDASQSQPAMISAPQSLSYSSSPPNSNRPKLSPKPKFSPEDDNLLIELKENRKMTWRQIAQHFDGRTAGALQVRYCTKLKSRTSTWTDQDISILRKALDDYEQERWNVISQRLGNKFSPEACRDKVRQMHEPTTPTSSSSPSSM